MRRVCVFCGSGVGKSPDYVTATRALAKHLVSEGIGIVFGGAKVGLMGVLADTALAAGGKVIGVIPQALVDREAAHTEVTELRVVSSMHERKATMEKLSDGFIALPGGYGTLEEILEILTWGQLGIHAKPSGFLNVRNYYDKFLTFLEDGVEDGFVRPGHRELFVSSSDPVELVQKMKEYKAPAVKKWITHEQT